MKFDQLKHRKDFQLAVWMHVYHQNIQHKQTDRKKCPICQTPATITIENNEDTNK